MSNYNNEVCLFVTRVDRRNPLEALINLFGIDADFEDVAEKLAKRIVKKYKKFETMVEKVIESEVDTDGFSNVFLLNNNSYCKDFKLEIHDADENIAFLSIAYII